MCRPLHYGCQHTRDHFAAYTLTRQVILRLTVLREDARTLSAGHCTVFHTVRRWYLFIFQPTREEQNKATGYSHLRYFLPKSTSGHRLLARLFPSWSTCQVSSGHSSEPEFGTSCGLATEVYVFRPARWMRSISLGTVLQSQLS